MKKYNWKPVNEEIVIKTWRQVGNQIWDHIYWRPYWQVWDQVWETIESQV